MFLTKKTENQTVKFNMLEGWSEEQAIAVKPVLVTSCQHLNSYVLAGESHWGSYTQWQSLCKELKRTPDRQLKFFFEHNFVPIQITPHKKVLFTGYYSPVIDGSLIPTEEYSVPLLKLPQDLIKVRLSDFGISKEMLVGRIEDGFVKPYSSRSEINQLTPNKQNVLLWLKNPVAKFFLQIQGSGNIRLSDGKIVHVVYAGNNGHNYVSIGDILKESGELKEVSMQTILSWLEKNPDKTEWLLNQNPRYIFFSISDEVAITAQGVSATSMRTLAVDPSYIPLGLPVWVDTRLTATGDKFQQMMVTQDTGNAIKGTNSADIYFGFGDEAARIAGQQRESGSLYVLIPRPIRKPSKLDKRYSLQAWNSCSQCNDVSNMDLDSTVDLNTESTSQGCALF